jgi:hypothetical protein
MPNERSVRILANLVDPVIQGTTQGPRPLAMGEFAHFPPMRAFVAAGFSLLSPDPLSAFLNRRLKPAATEEFPSDMYSNGTVFSAKSLYGGFHLDQKPRFYCCGITFALG